MERSIRFALSNSNFFHLFNEGKFTDVTLVYEGGMVKCHRVMLAASSYYFEELFSMLGELNNPVIVLKDIKRNNLMKILEFIYCGKIDVKVSEIKDFKKLAEYFKLKVEINEENETNDITIHELMSQETTVGDLTMDNFQISRELETFDDDYDDSTDDDSESTLSSRTNSIKLSKNKRHEPHPKKPKTDFQLLPSEGKLKCTFCHRYISEKYLNDHQSHCFKNKNRRPLKCFECRQEYELSTRLRNHMIKKHPEKNPLFQNLFF